MSLLKNILTKMKKGCLLIWLSTVLVLKSRDRHVRFKFFSNFSIANLLRVIRPVELWWLSVTLVTFHWLSTWSLWLNAHFIIGPFTITQRAGMMLGSLSGLKNFLIISKLRLLYEVFLSNYKINGSAPQPTLRISSIVTFRYSK